LGLERFDGVNVYGFNSPEWFMGQMGCIFAGGIAAGIYPSDTQDQVEYKSFHSSSSIAVVDTAQKAKIFLDAAARLPKLQAIIIWECKESDVLEDFAVPGNQNRTIKMVKWSELAGLAEKTSKEQLEERMNNQEPGQCCAYIYTSGTTGRPKAVMISHDNILFEAFNVLQMIPNGKVEEEERMVSFLPLSHVAGMMVDIVAPLCMTANGPGWSCVSFARPYDLKIGTIAARLKTVKPTLFLGVPRVWQKIAEKMKAVGASTKGVKKSLVTWAKTKGLKHQTNRQLGGTGQKPWGHGWANSLVLSKAKEALGLEECKFGFTGAAPIAKDTLEYFGALGIQINEVYGMSECTGATTWSTDEAHVWGSCGWTMAGTEVKIFRPADSAGGKLQECPKTEDMFTPTEEEQGEICFRGRHIMMGYMANPELGEEHMAEIKKKNEESIDEDGWLHSGDKGCMDVRGMVKITGRYKELIIGAGGENIAPVPIEDHVKKLCPAVSNIVMIGDKRKYNVAVLTLKAVGAEGEEPGTDALSGGALALHSNQKAKTISEAMKDQSFIDAIQKVIDQTNSNQECCTNNASKIQKWTILPHDFSVQGGELTPTLKIKRGVVMKHFECVIDALYDSKEKYVEYTTSDKQDTEVAMKA